MKIVLRAAMATLSISSISPAIADDGDIAGPNTYFTLLPGATAQAPQQAAAIATAQRHETMPQREAIQQKAASSPKCSLRR